MQAAIDRVSTREGWAAPRATPGRIVAILWAAAAVAAVVGPTLMPPAAQGTAVGAIVRTFLVLILTVATLFGPGLAVRFYLAGTSSLGWAILPGGGLLAATGLLAWVLAAHGVPAEVTSRIVLGPVTVALLVGAVASLWRSGRIEAAEPMVLTIVLLVLLVGAAKDLYSVDVPGDMFAAFVSRTYEPTIIPDSRIPYHVVQLVAHGAGPYSEMANAFFAPSNFSDRGPLPGLAAAPIVLTAGARVPSTLPDQPWAPFDQEGFAAYRLAMETFAAFTLLSLYSLVRRFAPVRTALFALVLAATTPFVVHEVYFTWPLLAAAGIVLLAIEQVFRGRPLRAGLAIGLAYLVHESGLIWFPALLVVAVLLLWRQRASNRVIAIARTWALSFVGALPAVLLWQLINLGHSGQGVFLQVPLEADTRLATSLTAWVDWRLQTLSDTLIPFHQLLTDSTQPFTWPPGQHLRAAERLGIGYWGTLPLGAGILFYPVLIFGIGKSLVRHPWVTVGCVLLPFLSFVVYWGSVDLGLLLAGLHAWVLGTLVVYAWMRSHPGWWPARLERVVLLVRVPEVGFMVLFAATWVQGRIYTPGYLTTDLAALAMLGVGLVGMLWFTWRVTDPAARVVEPEQTPVASQFRTTSDSETPRPAVLGAAE